MAERQIKFEIARHLGVLSEGREGWQKEANMVSWNDRPPKLDIREWDENHEKMGKGVTLNQEEAGILRDLLAGIDDCFPKQERESSRKEVNPKLNGKAAGNCISCRQPFCG